MTGSINQNWVSGMAIFTGAAGTVTLGETVAARALQFSTTGYRLEGRGPAVRLAGLPNGDQTLVRVDPGVTATIAADLIGAGGLHKADGGTLVLAGASSYAGGTTIGGGTLQIGAGGTTGSLAGDVSNDGILAFNRADALTFAGTVSGAGSLIKDGAGTLTLTGASSYTGSTLVQAGTLLVNGSLANTAVNVTTGATLGGTGVIDAAVTIGAGASLALGGGSPGTLTVGSLTLSPTSMLNYILGPGGIGPGGPSDRLLVRTDLTLDGTLNVVDVDGLGIGVHTLMTYGGTLIDNGLDAGPHQGGEASAIQSGGGQVNLVVGGGVNGPAQFWAGDSGSEVWTTAGHDWTDVYGLTRSAWRGQFGIFQGTAGTVTVEGVASFTGLQFRTDGYHLAGGVLSIAAPETIIRVDPP